MGRSHTSADGGTYEEGGSAGAGFGWKRKKGSVLIVKGGSSRVKNAS